MFIDTAHHYYRLRLEIDAFVERLPAAIHLLKALMNRPKSRLEAAPTNDS